MRNLLNGPVEAAFKSPVRSHSLNAPGMLVRNARIRRWLEEDDKIGVAFFLSHINNSLNIFPDCVRQFY